MDIICHRVTKYHLMLKPPNLIEVNGSYYQMGKPHDEVFESICDIEGHLFIADDDPTPEPEDNL